MRYNVTLHLKNGAHLGVRAVKVELIPSTSKDVMMELLFREGQGAAAVAAMVDGPLPELRITNDKGTSGRYRVAAFSSERRGAYVTNNYALENDVIESITVREYVEAFAYDYSTNGGNWTSRPIGPDGPTPGCYVLMSFERGMPTVEWQQRSDAKREGERLTRKTGEQFHLLYISARTQIGGVTWHEKWENRR